MRFALQLFVLLALIIAAVGMGRSSQDESAFPTLWFFAIAVLLVVALAIAVLQ